MTDIELIKLLYGCDDKQAKSRIERGVSKKVIDAYHMGYQEGDEDGFDAGVYWGRKYDDDGLDAWGR